MICWTPEQPIARYKVHVGTRRGQRWVYFADLKAATDFCNEVFRKMNVVLSIIAV